MARTPNITATYMGRVVKPWGTDYTIHVAGFRPIVPGDNGTETWVVTITDITTDGDEIRTRTRRAVGPGGLSPRIKARELARRIAIKHHRN